MTAAGSGGQDGGLDAHAVCFGPAWWHAFGDAGDACRRTLHVGVQRVLRDGGLSAEHEHHRQVDVVFGVRPQGTVQVRCCRRRQRLGIGEQQRCAQPCQQRSCAERVERHMSACQAVALAVEAGFAIDFGVAVLDEFGGLDCGVVAVGACQAGDVDAHLGDRVLDWLAQRRRAAHDNNVFDVGVVQVCGHIGVQLARRVQQHGVRAVSGERASHKRVGEDFAAGQDGRAAVFRHDTRSEPLGHRHCSAVAVIAGHPVHAHAGIVECSGYCRAHAAAGTVSVIVAVGPHEHRFGDADTLHELHRVGPQLVGRCHQHRGPQHSGQGSGNDRIGPALARYQHDRVELAVCCSCHGFGGQQRRCVAISTTEAEEQQRHSCRFGFVFDLVFGLALCRCGGRHSQHSGCQHQDHQQAAPQASHRIEPSCCHYANCFVV